MSKILVTLGALLVFVTLTASVTHADPIVVTSGSLTVTGIGGGPAYSLAGQNFTATASGGEFGNVGAQGCFPCLSGSLIGVNALFVGQSLGQGDVTINGMTFNDVFIAGVLEFGGAPLVVPVTTSSVILSGPFTMSGFIIGCLEPHLLCQTQLFTTQLVGSGIVTIELSVFIDSLGRSLFEFESITYTFTDSTIPEPASILLLTGGLAVFGGARWKRRRSV